jgi:hypothetical protein
MTKDFHFNTADALEKAKAARDKPVTPVEYTPVISDVGSDSNMLWPDKPFVPKGTGKLTLHNAAPVQEPVLQDIEQYRLQMAGISTAAIGYWKEGDGIHPDYDTPALRDVAKLYAKYDALYTAAQPTTEESSAVAAPVQEPDHGDELTIAYMSGLHDGKKKRAWVGLTRDEVLSIGKELGLKCKLGGNANIDFDYAEAIEAKLKEKNNG